MSFLSWLNGASVDEVKGYLNAAEKLVLDAKTAWDHHGKNLGEDVQVLVDVAQDLSGLPVIGPDAAMAAKGLEIVQFMVTHGTPHNSGEGGIGAAPEGNGNVTF